MATSSSGAKQHGPKRLITLDEAIQMVEADDSTVDADICSQPPDDGQASDYDSSDDDNVSIHWVLATPLGYIVNIIPYQGAETRVDTSNGLGFSVVEQLVSCLPSLPFHLSLDNFFTSIPLLSWLCQKKIGVTGTVRSNRTGNCPLKDPKLFKKEPRGSYDYRHDRNNGIIAAQWNDNVVILASNKYGIQSLKKAKRWPARDKHHVQIDQPTTIKMYNRKMGGVDRADQNIGEYRIQMRSKKWTWSLFSFYLDASAQNAWLLYRKSAEYNSRPLDQLAFKRDIVKVYLMRHKQDRTLGRPISSRGLSVDKRVPTEVRTDGVNHHLSAGSTATEMRAVRKKNKDDLFKVQFASACQMFRIIPLTLGLLCVQSENKGYLL